MKPEIPIINAEDLTPEVIDSLTMGSSASSNDRNRPYNGQPWTTDGIRGQIEVKGVTFRDLQDCLMQAILACADADDPEQVKLARKVAEIDADIQGTEYAADGTWTIKDAGQVDLSRVDVLALASNLCCFVEHYMGIYPANRTVLGPTNPAVEDTE